VVAGTVKIDPKRRPIAQRTERARIGSCHKQPRTRAELATFASLGTRRVSRDVTDGGERKRMVRETQTKKARTVTRRALVADAAASGLALAADLVSARRCPAAPLYEMDPLVWLDMDHAIVTATRPGTWLAGRLLGLPARPTNSFAGEQVKAAAGPQKSVFSATGI